MTRITLAGLVVGFFALTAPALAAGDKEHIEYRQKVMKSVGADMGAISDIVKHDLPFGTRLAVHASRMQLAAALITRAFEQSTADLATDAKPEIWTKQDEFKQAITDFGVAAKALEDAAKRGEPDEIQAAVKDLGKSCGGCHKPFRKPKEESYKKR